MPARGPKPALVGALAAAIALHALLWLSLSRYVVVRPPARSQPAAWHVNFRTAAPPQLAPAPTPTPTPTPLPPDLTVPDAPAAPVAVPEITAPEPADTPPPATRPRPAPTPQPPPQPAQPPEPAAPDLPASAALPDSARSASNQGGWLDATQADQAPVPIDNDWHLAEMPWPQAHPRITVQLWISSQGVIERYEIQGDAATDRAVQALIAPILDTPMRPARIGRAPVPSTMLIELWEGDGAVPNFVAPLVAPARP